MESSNRNLEASARSGASASRKAETSNSRRGRLAGTPSSDTLPAMNGGNVYDEGLNYLKQPPRRNHSSSIPTYAELYGSASSNNYEEEEDEPSFMKAIRRGSLSKEESQEKLKQRLSLVSDYADNAGSIEALKERFSTNKKTLKPRPGRIARRSSISSISSAFSSVQSEVTERTRSDDVSGIVSNYSMDLNELRMSTPVSQKKENVFSQSAATLPVTNIIRSRSETDLLQQPARKRKNVQTDQIVESLVWFSFHTPRAVLEDLIAHEMDVWRKEHSMDKPSSHSRSSRRSKQRLTSGGLLSNDDESDGSLSSLSDDEKQGENYGTNFSNNMMQLQQANASSMVKLPKSVERDCALLFVDMSGFTKLSTMLDVESLSKVINSYFDMIVSEVIQHGGDILKFAGDAFFAEWKVVDTPDDKTKTTTPLSELNASLVSINEMDWEDGDVPKLSSCVLQAAKCAVSIVEKFSDYHVTSIAGSTNEAMLNVHCGVGVGHIVGLHVGDYKEDQEEEGVELRREFLILGDPIDQVRLLTFSLFFEQSKLLTNFCFFLLTGFQSSRLSD
jgi:class 3 adenylate cyclase